MARSGVPAGARVVVVTRHSRGNVSRVLEGGTQGRSVEKKFNCPGRAQVLRLAPGTRSPSPTAFATAASSTSPSAWHGACQEVPHQRGDLGCLVLQREMAKLERVGLGVPGVGDD